MYNTDLPTRAELPSAMKLMQSTILAAIVAYAADNHRDAFRIRYRSNGRWPSAGP
jgi:hypothetical protein